MRYVIVLYLIATILFATGCNNRTHDNVIIDHNNVFLIEGLYTIYPFAIFFNQGKIEKVMYGKPELSAIFYLEIKKYLLTSN